MNAIDWSRPQDITTRDGRKVRIFVTDAVGECPVVGQIENSFGVQIWSKNGSYGNSTRESPADLIQTTPKQRVPLGPLDVPPGSALRFSSWHEGEYKMVTRVGVDCLHLATGGVHYKTLMEELGGHWQIKRPGEEWQPAWKEV